MKAPWGREKGVYAGGHPVDVQVGSRIRLRRNMLGMSQTRLAEAIGLTFQQVQKYERGNNRVGAGRLHAFSRILDVPVLFFFDDTDPVRAPAISDGLIAPAEDDLLSRPDTTALVDAYYAIRDPRTQEQLFQLAKALARDPDQIASKAGPRRRSSPRRRRAISAERNR